MKKLYLSILVILLPAILYCAVFFANDPYGYFRENTELRPDAGLTEKMLAYRNGSYDALIIGDSRMTSFDAAELSGATGRNYINMSYGGCMTEEMVYLLQWCMDNKNTQLKEVVIVTSFYNMNTLLQQNRVASTEKVIESPLQYAFNVENASKMFGNLTAGNETESESAKKEITPERKKANFAASAEAMDYYLKGYAYDETVLQQLCDICDVCQENDIQIKIVLPPWWEGFYTLLEQHQLMQIHDVYKQRLSQHATIYDLEYAACLLNANYDDFSDYSHFKGETFQAFVRMLTENDTTYCKIWQKN